MSSAEKETSWFPRSVFSPTAGLADVEAKSGSITSPVIGTAGPYDEEEEEEEEEEDENEDEDEEEEHDGEEANDNAPRTAISI